MAVGIVFAGVAALLLAGLVGGNDNSSERRKLPAGPIAVSAGEFGGDWPYPGFSIARINCGMVRFGDTTRPVMTIELGDRKYGLNGVASGIGGFPDSRSLMERDPVSGAYRLGATHQLIDIANEICGR